MGLAVTCVAFWIRIEIKPLQPHITRNSCFRESQRERGWLLASALAGGDGNEDGDDVSTKRRRATVSTGVSVVAVVKVEAGMSGGDDDDECEAER